MVVVLISRREMPIEPVETARLAASGFAVRVDRKSIQRPTDRQLSSKNVGEMRRGEVIVVVVGSAGMSAVIVELAGKIGVGATVLFDRVDDRHAIGGNGNRTAEERFPGRHGTACKTGLQRKPKGVGPDIGLRSRNLAIPRPDPDHQPVPRHSAALHVEVLIVPAHIDTAGECPKGTRHDFGIETEGGPWRFGKHQCD